MAAVAGKIYSIGGMVGQMGNRLASGEVYDPARNEWKPIARMPTARSSTGTAAVGDQIYVIGGYAESGTTDVVEVYDTRADAWRAGAPLPTKRFDAAIAVVGPWIYVIGGYDARSVTTVEALDTQTGRWQAVPPLPTPRYAFQAVVVDGKIWAMGGRNDGGATEVIEVFDPAKQTWTRASAKLPEAIAGFGAVAVPGRVHVAKYDKHWALDVKTNRWQTLAPMLTSRHGLQLAYIDGIVYAVGGCATGDGNLYDVARTEAFIVDSAPAP